MKKVICLGALLVSCFAVSASGGLEGAWKGVLKVNPATSLRIVLNVDGEKVTMDSPDQNAYGIECETTYRAADSIDIKVARLMMNYSGALLNDTLRGTFKQGAFSCPLVFVRERINRPQTPMAPFPYLTEEVRIKHGDVTLAGSLTSPRNADRTTPIVVLVSGSGAQNRDEEIFEHKPFAVIADYLARNGIASLRYDDRGFGESTGSRDTATTADYAGDAQSVVEWLRAQKRFGKLGLIGHSEGGVIAYMLGAKKQGPEFIVSIAGPTVKGTKTSAYQNKALVMSQGVSEQHAEDFRLAVERAFEYRLKNGALEEDSEEVLAEVYPQYMQDDISDRLASAILRILGDDTKNEWLDYYFRYDPAEDLKHLKIPAFLIFGEKDRQVPPSLNVEPARRYAAKAKVVEYDNLNHMMQHCQTGDVSEYKEIEETFAPKVLVDIVEFIKSLK